MSSPKPESESLTRRLVITSIVCLGFALIIHFYGGKEIAKIDAMGAEAYAAHRRAVAQMNIPATFLTFLMFVGMYGGSAWIVRKVLDRLFPAKPPAKPVRIEPDWKNRDSGITIETRD